MNVRLISSLTDDDEDRFALVLLKAVADLLRRVPIAYSLRVETTRGRIFHRSRTTSETTSTLTRRAGTGRGS
jgi:hypothetical protein